MRSRRRSPRITFFQYLQRPEHYELEHDAYLDAWKKCDVHIMDRKVHLN